MRKISIVLALVIIFAVAAYLNGLINRNNQNEAIVSKAQSNDDSYLEKLIVNEEPKIKLDKFYAPILLYHHIADAQQQNSYYVSPKIFEQQLIWLKDNGYHVVTMEKLFEASTGQVGLPEKPVIISFDDGLRDQYTNAFPILKKYQMNAIFFIKINNYDKGGITTQQLKEMVDSGMEVGSHSVNHDNMAQMDQKTLDYELQESKRILEKDLGVRIKFFSYPGGAYSDETIAATKKAGYIAAVTTKHRVYQEIKNNDSLYTFSRIHIDDEMPTFIDWVQGKNLY